MSDQQLREKLAQARQTIEEQADELERLAQPPHQIGIVLQDDDETITVMTDRGLAICDPPPVEVLVGEYVTINPETGSVIDTIEDLGIGGEVAVVSRVYDETAEVAISGGTTVLPLADPLQDTLKEGDKVVLSRHRAVIVGQLPRDEQPFTLDHETGVSWDDIGGQAKAKRIMQEAVELPLQYRDLYQSYGKRFTKGVLLSGPPGCGKTMLAKAAATAVAEHCGQGAHSAFMYVKGPELLDPYVGATEANVRGLFTRAREHHAEFGCPAVIFIDEAEALLARRGSRHNMMDGTVVPMFLAEMDGLDESGALVILATNRPDTLDPAITREGRIDQKVTVARPDREDVASIASTLLGHLPTQEPADDLAEFIAGSLFTAHRPLLAVQTEDGEVVDVGLHSLVSGALVAGIVDKALSAAIARDIEHGRPKPSGVSLEDVRAALAETYHQSVGTDHTDVVAEAAAGRKVINVERNHAKAA